MPALYVLFLNVGVYFVITGAYPVIMPILGNYYGASNTAVQYTMTIYQFSTIVSCLIAAFYADIIGKKNSIILSLLVIIAGSVVCYYSSTIEMLVVGRFIQGLGVSSAYILAIAAINDLAGENGALKAYGQMALIANCMFVISPFIAGLLAYYIGWHSIFIFMLLFALTLALYSHIIIPEHLNSKSKTTLKERLSQYKTVVMNRKYLTYIQLQPIMVSMIWFSMAHTTFYFQQKLGVTSDHYGYIIALIISCFGFGAMFSHRFSNRYGRDNGIYSGLAIILSGIILIIIVHYVDDTALVPIILGLCLFQFGAGLSVPASVAIAMNVHPHLTTQASAFRTLMITIFAYLTNEIAEFVDETSLLPLGIVLLAFWVATYISFSLRPERIT